MAQDKKYQLFVDNEKYEWGRSTITAPELRALASIPQGVQIFQHLPGKPDLEILDTSVIDLEAAKGAVKFSTQSPGSQAGGD